MHTAGPTNLLQALGWAVLNSLWQMALLWVIYQLITGINKTAKSSIKTSLASGLLIAGFVWFIYTFLSVLTSQPATAVSSGLAGIDTNLRLNNWLQQTLPVTSVIYLVLLILPLLHFIRNYRYVHIIRRYGLTKADVQWRIFVNKVAVQMGIKKKVQIWISELVSSPVTIGFLKPVILFPLAAINRLTPEQLEAVLLHELSHIRRFDYLVNLIINAIQTILYFNPFVKAFVKTVEREREKNCDEMVMQFQYDPHGYATALLILEKANHMPRPLAIAAAGKRNDLLNRVENILGVHKKPVISFNKLAGLFAGLLAVIALNALLIINQPAKTNPEGSFTSLSSPFSFFTGGGLKSTRKPAPVQMDKQNSGESVWPGAVVTTENQKSPIANHPIASITKAKTKQSGITREAILSTAAYPPGFVNVKFEPVVEVPALKNYQEIQLKEAIDASRKVLENIHWKAVEEKIAEVLTRQQKNMLKSTYKKELEKLDWNKLEDKLRLAYDHIDWEKMNEQLGKAVNIIRLDSLQQSYNEAASNLGLVAKELEANELTGIPDTDITLKEVEQKKVQVEKALHILKAVRNKKTVHL
jgi:bla regulator protein blaR1